MSWAEFEDVCLSKCKAILDVVPNHVASKVTQKKKCSVKIFKLNDNAFDLFNIANIISINLQYPWS